MDLNDGGVESVCGKAWGSVNPAKVYAGPGWGRAGSSVTVTLECQ